MNPIIKNTKKLLSHLGLRSWLINHDLLRPEFQQSLIKRPISQQLIQNFDGDSGQNLDPNDEQYFLGFGLIHYALVRNLRPKRILCIGSCKGFIPAILALACKDNAYGQVDFVDAAYDQYDPADSERHWRGIGFWRDVDAKQHFQQLAAEKYIQTHVMTSQDYAKKFTKRHYQYIYIDGDHSYAGVKQDYQLFWPKLEKNGIMLFHDVMAHGQLDQGEFGVWQLWQELKNRHQIILPFPKESGLGIIQK